MPGRTHHFFLLMMLCISCFIATRVQAQAESTPILPWPDLSASVTPVGGGENDAALIVAIEDYDHVLDVPGARDTASDWYAWFVDGLNIPAHHVKFLPERNATREEILAELNKKAGVAANGGRLWFIFVGHGAPSKTDSALLGVDVRATPISIESRSISLKEVLDVANTSAAQPVLIVDACFSGEARDGSAVVKGLMPLENIPVPASGRAVIATASAGDEYAGELPGGSRPAFSYLTLGALQGWGDQDDDGKVTADEMVAYSQRTLAALLTGRTQTPELKTPQEQLPLTVATHEGPDMKTFAKLLANGPVPQTESGAAGPRDASGKRPSARPRKTGLILTGIGAGIGITGVIIGALSRRSENNIHDRCPTYQCDTVTQNELDTVRHMNIAADAFFVTAGITITVGIVVSMVQNRKREKTTALLPIVGTEGAGFALGRSF